MAADDIAPWSSAWAWGTVLIVLTAIIHTTGLVTIHGAVAPALKRHVSRRGMSGQATFFIGLTVLIITALHGVEAGLWAGCYLMLGAFPHLRQAMLYSVEAITTYGHSDINLPEHWRLLGALEALNGMILFGLTTAYLFAVLQETVLFQRGRDTDGRDR